MVNCRSIKLTAWYEHNLKMAMRGDKIASLHIPSSNRRHKSRGELNACNSPEQETVQSEDLLVCRP
jgi:hypothetical protein